MRIDQEFGYLINISKFDKSNGYYKVYVNGKSEYVHRVVMAAVDGQIVDHINRDKTDNRKSNLRIVSKSLNNYNRDCKNPLGKGLYFDKSGNRFRACISHMNKTLKLGSFKTALEAKIAYNKKAKEIYADAAYQHDLREVA